MISQLLIGTAMIFATVTIVSCFIALAVAGLRNNAHTLRRMGMFTRTMVMLSALTLWLLAGITSALWLWAGAFVLLGEFDSFASALYFSSVSATTLGYGDSLLSERWQLLSGFIAANGLVLFSLNTAFLFEVLRHVVDAQTTG